MVKFRFVYCCLLRLSLINFFKNRKKCFARLENYKKNILSHCGLKNSSMCKVNYNSCISQAYHFRICFLVRWVTVPFRHNYDPQFIFYLANESDNHHSYCKYSQMSLRNFLQREIDDVEGHNHFKCFRLKSFVWVTDLVVKGLRIVNHFILRL